MELETDPPENEDLNDFFCFENSQDRYFDINDMDSFFQQNQQDEFFSMCINIRGLNLTKNYIRLVALIE